MRKKCKGHGSKNKDWETSVKMTLIARDLMTGNPKLAELGYGEEALGYNLFPQVSKVSVNGRIISQMVILWRQF